MKVVQNCFFFFFVGPSPGGYDRVQAFYFHFENFVSWRGDDFPTGFLIDVSFFFSLGL